MLDVNFEAATFGWLCVETALNPIYIKTMEAATFGWLCVETSLPPLLGCGLGEQPPSGGCVLKPMFSKEKLTVVTQPPSGGCVLKLSRPQQLPHFSKQPPSGGCVLKPHYP